MPKFWDSETLVILPGTGVQVDWGPDFGDPADDNSWTARGSVDINALALNGEIIVLATLILSIAITSSFDLTSIIQAQGDSDFQFTGPWIVEGDITFDETIDFDLLLVAVTLTRDIAPLYSLICQCAPRFDTLIVGFTGPWTAIASLIGGGTFATDFADLLTTIGTIEDFELTTVYNRTCQSTIFADTFELDHTKICEVNSDGDLDLSFTGPWTALGTIAYIIGPTYDNNCEGDIFFDTIQLNHTKNCNCAPRISAEAITYTGPWTCNADIGQLNYELDFVGAATGVDINVTVPTGATSMFSEVWSGGGGGGTALVNGGGGGGGGGFASDTEPVAAGTTITVQVGAGGAVGAAGGLSRVQEAGTTRCNATGGGAGGNGGAGGQGAAGARGDANTGDTLRDGGLGGGGGGVQINGGGGGGGSGTANAGGSGAANRTAGTGGANLGGNGGIGGGGVGAPSAAGSQRGGGGGGASTTQAASAGARGGVRIRFDIPTP